MKRIKKLFYALAFMQGLSVTYAADSCEQEDSQNLSSSITKGGDGFCFMKMDRKTPRGKDLWLVGEQLSKKNIGLWRHYINQQTNSKAIGFISGLSTKDGRSVQKGTLGDGSKHFKGVLDGVYGKGNNKVRVIYVTRAEKPIRIPDNIEEYLSDFSGNYEFASNIEMFVTVTSSSEALLTSHMGIARSLEGAQRIFMEDGVKGISPYIHAFGAYLELMENPHKKFMINAPMFAMENIIANALPDHTFVGTRQMKGVMKERQGVLIEDFKNKHLNTIREKLQARAKKDLKTFNESVEREHRNQRSQGKEVDIKSIREEEAEYIQSHELIEKTPEGDVIISQSKIKKCIDLDREYDKYRNPFSFPPARESKTESSEFLKFMEKHPPLLSVDGTSSFREKMSIYETPDSQEPWLTISNDNRGTYDWMYRDIFSPSGETHYIAVDLKALADLLWTKTIRVKDYDDPAGEFVKTLRNNPYVKSLIINVPGGLDTKKTQSNNYENLIQEGLRDKPYLKSLTIRGGFDMDPFYPSGAPEELTNFKGDPLNSPHTVFFKGLEEMRIEGKVLGPRRQYPPLFYAHFVKPLPNLKKFSTTDERLQKLWDQDHKESSN